MIFTVQDIQNLFGIIEYRIARVVADVLGKEFLSPDDERILKENGFDWTKELKKIPTYWQAFIFGRLSSFLTPQQLQKLDYTDLNKYIERKQYKQPNKREMAEYNVAATNTYSYIKGMGNKIKDTLSNSVSQEELKILTKEREEEVRQGIKEEIERGVLEKRSVQNIISNLGHKLDEWNRDWGRIVETEMQNIYLLGKAQTIMEDYGPDANVYKHVFKGACSKCIQFYTTQGIGSQPRIFKMNELIDNGSNIGRKQVDWKPTLGPVHPFCYPENTEVFTDKGFVRFEDLKGDELFWSVNLDIDPYDWEYVKTVGKINETYCGNLDRWKSNDGKFDLITTPNHNHVVKFDEDDGTTSLALKKTEDIDEEKDSFVWYDFESKRIVFYSLKELKHTKVPYQGKIYDVELERNHTLLIKQQGQSMISGNCRCELHYIPEGYVWDEETEQFQPPKEYKRKVERKSKVKIQVGDKTFEV